MATTGRYGELPIRRHVLADGSSVRFRARRFLPADGATTTRTLVPVDGVTRIDQVAAQHIGDPAAWWRICDANSVMTPAELEVDVGREIRIPHIAPEVHR